MLGCCQSRTAELALKNIPANVEEYKTWLHKNRSTYMFVVSLDEFSTIDDVVKVLRRYFLGGMIRVVQVDKNKYIIHVFVQAP